MKDAVNTTDEITKLVKKSSKRDAKLSTIQKVMTSEETEYSKIRPLCPTRWTVQTDALHSIVNNYKTMQEMSILALDICSDTEMKDHIHGYQVHMERFDFFGLVMGQCHLQHADSLSASLQATTLYAAEAQSIADMKVKTLHHMCNNEQFGLF